MSELSKRLPFCRELAAVQVTGDTFIEEARAAVLPLIEAYKFPTKGHYEGLAWADILLEVRLIHEPLPPIWPWRELQRFELQFVYLGTVGQRVESGSSLPIIEGVSIELMADLTPREARDLIVRRCVEPFRRFRRRAGRLVQQALRPRFGTRILTLIQQPPLREEPGANDGTVRITLPDPLYRTVVLGDLTVTFRKGRRTRGLLDEIANRAMPYLAGALSHQPAQGRRPASVKHARWWAITVFDRMTPERIANLEMFDHPDAADMVETIERALRRLGLSVRTK